MKKTYLYFLILALILILINPTLSAKGAAEGLVLWLNTVIPTLFPFIIISNMLVKLYGKSFKNPVIFPVLLGILCGFPVAASLASGLSKDNVIDKRTAQFIAGSANMASPMFISAYAISFGLCRSRSVIPLFYIPAIILITVLYIIYKPSASKIPETKNDFPGKRELLCIFDDCIALSSSTLIKIGGYIIIFSMIATIISGIPIGSPILKASVIGIIEMTNGISYISNTCIPDPIKLLIITTMVNFGGLCTIAQTNCVIRGSCISLKEYIYSKLLFAVITYLTVTLYNLF